MYSPSIGQGFGVFKLIIDLPMKSEHGKMKESGNFS